MATLTSNLDVFCGDWDIYLLRLFEDGRTDVLGRLAIYGGKAGRALNGILELYVIDQNRDDFNAEVDHGEGDGEKKDELEAAVAPLRKPCRKVLLPSGDSMATAFPQACKASELPRVADP